MKVSSASSGAKKFERLVSKNNFNANVYHVHPGLVTTSNEQVTFIFKGTAKKDIGLLLVGMSKAMLILWTRMKREALIT